MFHLMEKLRHLLTLEGLWSLSILLRDNWATLLAALLGGGGLTYLSLITDWISDYGPIAWGVAFFIGAYLTLGALYVWTSIASRRFINRQAEAAFVKSGINPKDTKFENQSVPLAEFYSAYYFSQQNKVFIDCDIFGPSLLFMDGCSLDGVQFRHCQIIVCKEDTVLYGITAFKRCKIIGGTMANTTLVMSKDQYDDMPDELKENVQTMHKLA